MGHRQGRKGWWRRGGVWLHLLRFRGRVERGRGCLVVVAAVVVADAFVKVVAVVFRH